MFSVRQDHRTQVRPMKYSRAPSSSIMSMRRSSTTASGRGIFYAQYILYAPTFTMIIIIII